MRPVLARFSTMFSETAAVRLHVPWDADRDVCLAHARAMVQQDGVVAEPLDSAGDEYP